MAPRAGARAERAIFALCVVGAVALVNLAASRLHGRLDLTDDHRFTVSATSRDLVRGLPDPLTIKAYISRDLPPEPAARGRYLRDLLEELRLASNGQLRVEIEGRNDEAAEAPATRCGIERTPFQVRQGQKLEVVRGYLGLCLWYGGRSRELTLSGAPAETEYQLAALIKRMTSKPRKVAFSVGHGERDLGDDYSFIKLALGREHELVTLDPAAGSLGDDVDLLIVAGPRRRFDDHGRLAIARFLEAGKGVVFLLDGMTPAPGDAGRGRAAGLPIDTGLDPIFERYGLRVRNDLVFDRQNAPGAVAGDEALVANRPAFVEATPRQGRLPMAPFSAGIPVLVFPFPSSIDRVQRPVGAVPVGEALWSLATSSPESWRLPATEPADARGPFMLGCAYRGGGPRRPVRFVLIGNSGFAADPEARLIRSFPIYAGGPELLLRATAWLLEDEALEPLRANVERVRPLHVGAETHADAILWANAAGTPLALCVAGIWRWRRRRSKTARLGWSRQ